MRVPLIYKDTPQFGFDIGTHAVKVVRLKRSGHQTELKGYGSVFFPQEAMVEGIIADPDEMAAAIRPLLQKLSYGKLDSRRAVTGLPAAKLFTRTLQLPTMNESDLIQAVHYEVEQYVPVPVSDLYIDYEIVNSIPGKEANIEILMMAAPRAIVDSYITLFDKLGLELGAIEASLTAVVRTLLQSGDAGDSTLVMDIGTVSTDLTIHDKFMPLTGSVQIGGEAYTNTLVKALKLKPDEAEAIKHKFGVAPSKVREKVFAALEPQFSIVAKEAKKVIKFYQSRGGGKQKVSSMVISGGTANMPGIEQYFAAEIGLPLKVADPWRNIDTGQSNMSKNHEASMYTTAIGLALRGLK